MRAQNYRHLHFTLTMILMISNIYDIYKKRIKANIYIGAIIVFSSDCQWLTYIDRLVIFKEDLEDTKGVIRIRKSKDRQHNDQKKDRQLNDQKKDRQHNDHKKDRQLNDQKKDRQLNDQKKNEKGTNDEHNKLHIKLKIEKQEPY